MRLPENVSAKIIDDIWAPRYNKKTTGTRDVMIAKYKVGDHNIISFTKAPTYPDKYYLSRATIEKYPIMTNGTIPCYSVPVDEMVLYEGRM